MYLNLNENNWSWDPELDEFMENIESIEIIINNE